MSAIHWHDLLRMTVVCEKCGAQFRLDDAKVGDLGLRVRCSKCQHLFLARRPSIIIEDEPSVPTIVTQVNPEFTSNSREENPSEPHAELSSFAENIDPEGTQPFAPNILQQSAQTQEALPIPVPQTITGEATFEPDEITLVSIDDGDVVTVHPATASISETRPPAIAPSSPLTDMGTQPGIRLGEDAPWHLPTSELTRRTYEQLKKMSGETSAPSAPATPAPEPQTAAELRNTSEFQAPAKPTPESDQTSLWQTAFTVFLGILVTAVGALFYLGGGKIDWLALKSGKIPSLVPLRVAQTVPTYGGVRILNWRVSWYPTIKGRVLIFSGELENRATTPETIELVAELKNQDGVVIASSRAPLGVQLPLSQVYQLTTPDSLTHALAKATEQQNSIVKSPGKAESFVVVLLNPPEHAPLRNSNVYATAAAPKISEITAPASPPDQAVAPNLDNSTNEADEAKAKLKTKMKSKFLKTKIKTKTKSENTGTPEVTSP